MARKKKPHLLIVEARFYDDLADALLDGAKAALDAAGATYDRGDGARRAGNSGGDFLRARRRRGRRHRV